MARNLLGRIYSDSLGFGGIFVENQKFGKQKAEIAECQTLSAARKHTGRTPVPVVWPGVLPLLPQCPAAWWSQSHGEHGTGLVQGGGVSG